MVTYTLNKIHENLSIAYIAIMAEEEINYLKLTNQRAITPLALRIY